MNMNRKFVLLLLLFFSFFIFNLNVIAAPTTTKINCNSLSNKTQCSVSGKCRWINGRCTEQYVASEPCSDNNIKTVLKIAGLVLLVAKIIVPLLIIGYGIFDLYKAVVDKDEKSLSKQAQMVLLRIVIGLIVFFIPNLVHAIFKMSDKLNVVDTADYQTCASCVLDPLNTSECNTTDVFPNAGIN